MSPHDGQTTPGAGKPQREEDVPAVWQPGEDILGLYEVKHVHQGGAMGLVYRVRHRVWNVDLAVKTPKPEILAKAGGAANFSREAETWVKLGLHPNVVSCYYVRTLGGIPRVFAEYVEGDSLSDWARGDQFHAGGLEQTLPRILDVAIQFAWGLHHAHEQGLVHQDVKPLNVLVRKDGAVKVTDFGLARARPTGGPATGASPLATFVGGTPAYFSPEQAEAAAQAKADVLRERRVKLTRATDVWSWALSVLEMFYGEPPCPYGGQVAAATFAAYLEAPVEEGLPAMPAGLVGLLRRCFRRDPRERPADLREAASALIEIYRETTGSPYPRPVPRPAEALADSLNNQAVALLDLGREDEAAKLFEEALRTHPHHPEATYNQGIRRWRSGDIDDEGLLQELHEVSRSLPRSPVPPYLRGLVHLEQGGAAEAVQALEEAARGAPEDIQVREALATGSAAVSPQRTFEGHTNWVVSLCLSPDGRQALSGACDGTVRLWDIASGRCLHVMSGHHEIAKAVSASADWGQALSGDDFGRIRLWDLATGRCLRTLEGHTGSVQSICFGPDDRHALSGSTDKALKLWDLHTGRCIRTFAGHDHNVSSVCLHPGGRLVLSASFDRTLRLWEISTGRCLRTLEGHTGGVFAVTLNRDGSFAVSASGDNTLKRWNLETGTCTRTVQGHTKFATVVALSQDDRLMLSGSWDESVKLWEVETGRCVRTWRLNTPAIGCAALSEHGDLALVGRNDGRVQLWRTGWGQKPFRAPPVLSQVVRSEAALSVQSAFERLLSQGQEALTRGDVSAAAACFRRARAEPGCQRRPEAMAAWCGLYTRLPHKTLSAAWEVAELTGHGDFVGCVAISRDGRLIASGSDDRTVRLWDVPTMRHKLTLEGHSNNVRGVCFSPDGKTVLSGSFDGSLKLWETQTGCCLRTFTGHTNGIHSVKLSGDGKVAVSCSSDRTVKLWDVPTGRCLTTFEGPTARLLAATLSRNGIRALAGGSDKCLYLWDTRMCHLVQALEGHTGTIWSVDIDPRGRTAASAGEDKVVKVWDLEERKCVRDLGPHDKGATGVCFTADSRFVVSGCLEGAWRMFEIKNGECLGTFRGHADMLLAVGVDDAGQYAVTSGADKLVKVWMLDWELEVPSR